MLSAQAFGLPGRVTIRVLPRITDTPLDSMALGVMVMEAARMASAMPGAFRWDTASTASGVVSRGAETGTPGGENQIQLALIGQTGQLLL